MGIVSVQLWDGNVAAPVAPAQDKAAWYADFLKQRRAVMGGYDAARMDEATRGYWAHADAFDADSANSREVRQRLVRNSRYEVANNGYSDGIAHTYSTDLCGVGPTLRMQTGSKPFNQLIERQFYLWAKSAKLRRKLWCMAHAKHVDGEALAIMRINPRLKHPVKLDFTLHETEQCQTPFPPITDPTYIDGIKSDGFGEALWYDFLRHHPGKTNAGEFALTADRIPADRVLHWFKLRRPGQHRGVPECASTLNLGAAFRRLREANLSTAEKVAAWTLFLKTMFEPDQIQTMPPFDTMEVLHGLITSLPNSMEPFQLKAEHPGPSYETFHKSLLNEQARPKSMPFNKAACDSSDYNYASGRLDHQTYYGHLDVDREDCNELVLDPLFDLWFWLAVKQFGWLGGDPESVGDGARWHVWDWPKHRVADVEAEANANQTKLKSAQIFPHRLLSDSGLDWEDECEAAAESSGGLTPDEIKRRVFDQLLPPATDVLGQRKRDLVEAIQKIYLGVGRVVTSDEARQILNAHHDAALNVPGPEELGPANPEPVDPSEARASLLMRAGINGNGVHHG